MIVLILALLQLVVVLGNLTLKFVRKPFESEQCHSYPFFALALRDRKSKVIIDVLCRHNGFVKLPWYPRRRHFARTLLR